MPPIVPNEAPRRIRPDRILLTAGLFQLVAVFTPAVRVRLAGTRAFLRLPSAGVALLGLAVLTMAIAFRPRGWWRWLSGTLSAVIVVVAYWKVVHAPSGTFFDPVLRHAVYPAWGFVPMSASVVLTLAAAALVRPALPVVSSGSAPASTEAIPPR